MWNKDKRKIIGAVIFSGIIALSALAVFFAANGYKEDSSVPHVEGLLRPIRRESVRKIYDGGKRVIEVKDGTLSSDGATFVYKNLEEYDISYLEYIYWVEVQIKGKWYEIVESDDRIYEFAERYLAPGEEKERELGWYYYYGSLPPGNYRLLQSFSEMISSDSNITIACEFTITEDVVNYSKKKSSGAHINHYPWLKEQESDLLIYDGGKIKIEVAEDTLTPFGATVILSNFEEYDLYFESSFILEMQIDNKWHALVGFGPGEMDAHAADFRLRPGETQEWKFALVGRSWEKIKDCFTSDGLPRGKYRYIKIFYESPYWIPLKKHVNVACEFTIE